MIKRITIVFFFTGLGQLLSIFALKFIFSKSPITQINGIAELDTTIQLLINVIAFSLQAVAIRSIAITEDWVDVYKKTQIARFTLGLLLCFFCLASFYKEVYWIFVITPLLALNGDYALYARGESVIGAMLAFFRLVVPLLFAIYALNFYPSQIVNAYFLGAVISYSMSNVIIANYLKVPLFYAPSLKSLKLYLRGIPLGIITLCFYFLGLGLLFVVSLFFTDSTFAIAFIALKFYVLYKGILRVLHQAFVREMINLTFCLRIDKLSILIGLIYFGSIIFFPKSFISLFFGEQSFPYKNLFLLLGLAGLVYSVFLSSTTKAMLDKKDIMYLKVAVASALASGVSLVALGLFWNDFSIVGISLLIGELILAIGLAKSFLSWNDIVMRLKFVTTSSLVLGGSMMVRFIFSDNTLVFLSSVIVFILVSLVFNFKQLNLNVTSEVN